MPVFYLIEQLYGDYRARWKVADVKFTHHFFTTKIIEIGSFLAELLKNNGGVFETQCIR